MEHLRRAERSPAAENAVEHLTFMSAGVCVVGALCGTTPEWRAQLALENLLPGGDKDVP